MKKWNIKKFIKNMFLAILVIYTIYIIVSMFYSVLSVMSWQEFLNI